MSQMKYETFEPRYLALFEKNRTPKPKGEITAMVRNWLGDGEIVFIPIPEFIFDLDRARYHERESVLELAREGDFDLARVRASKLDLARVRASKLDLAHVFILDDWNETRFVLLDQEKWLPFLELCEAGVLQLTISGGTIYVALFAMSQMKYAEFEPRYLALFEKNRTPKPKGEITALVKAWLGGDKEIVFVPAPAAPDLARALARSRACFFDIELPDCRTRVYDPDRARARGCYLALDDWNETRFVLLDQEKWLPFLELCEAGVLQLTVSGGTIYVALFEEL